MEEPILVWAARLGKLEMVRLRLCDKESPSIFWSDNGMSALIAAIRNGHEDVASLLITSGADLNHKDMHGRTAIQYSQISSDIERSLLASGATDRRTLELIEQQEKAERELIRKRERERKARELKLKEENIKIAILEKRKAQTLFLEKHSITCLYHFTDIRNLQSIRDSGGLFPWARIKNQVPAPGGNDWSHDADEKKGHDSYVHLCFLPAHPMEFVAKKDGRIIESRFLQIDTSVIFKDGVLFYPDVANKAGVEPLNFEEAIKILDFEIIDLAKRSWLDEVQFKRKQNACKYEILIPDDIPSSLIKGL